MQRPFTLEKEGGWDSIALGVLKESLDQSARAELWAVVMQEGLANVCLITGHQTILRQRIEMSIPKKRAGASSSDHEKGSARFFSTLLDTVLRQMGLSPPTSSTADPKPLLLASPGFTATTFQSYIKTQAVQRGDKTLSSLVPKIIVAHAASAHLHSLAEVLASPAVTAKLADTRFARETALMDRFYALLRADDGRAWYGPREVERAVDRGAVGRGGGVLLISDALFRAQNVGVRRRWVRLVDRVREVEGGEVRVLSSMHESGRRLEGLGGVAAILTFPIEDVEEEEGVEGEGEGVEENLNGRVEEREVREMVI